MTPEIADAKARAILDQGLPPIVLCTVQHTASRFWLTLLQQHYGNAWPIHQPGRPLYFDHCRDSLMDSIKARVSEGAKLVTTYRSPKETWTSWENRSVNTSDEFVEQWNNWNEWVYPNADLIVSVFQGEGSRESSLHNLSLLTGREYVTDWKPVG